MPLKDFKDSPIAKDLQDTEFASGYLEDGLREGMTDFIIALRNVADANGGVGKLSEISNLARESLYKTLSQSGDSRPYFSTIQQILTALGFELSITPIDLDDDQEVA
jgi:probable addiction module antidote protein